MAEDQRHKVKVSRLYLPNEGSLAVCEPPVMFEPRTHRLRGWTVDFLAQVPRRLLECPELVIIPMITCRVGGHW